MIILIRAPRAFRGIFLFLFPFVIAAGLFFVVGSFAYREYKAESWYQNEYGANWEQRYNDQHVEPLARTRQKLMVGGAGVAVVATIMVLIVRQYAKALGVETAPGRSGRRRRRSGRSGSSERE